MPTRFDGGIAIWTHIGSWKQLVNHIYRWTHDIDSCSHASSLLMQDKVDFYVCTVAMPVFPLGLVIIHMLQIISVCDFLHSVGVEGGLYVSSYYSHKLPAVACACECGLQKLELCGDLLDIWNSCV